MAGNKWVCLGWFHPYQWSYERPCIAGSGTHFASVTINFQPPNLLGKTLENINHIDTWNPKRPFINGCFNWMIPNHYIKNGCFTKHPSINDKWLIGVPGSQWKRLTAWMFNAQKSKHTPPLRILKQKKRHSMSGGFLSHLTSTMFISANVPLIPRPEFFGEFWGGVPQTHRPCDPEFQKENWGLCGGPATQKTSGVPKDRTLSNYLWPLFLL